MSSDLLHTTTSCIGCTCWITQLSIVILYNELNGVFRAIRWVPESREEEGEAVEFGFKEISMSAVAHVPEIGSDSGSCLYLQIDQEIDDADVQMDEEEGSRDVYLIAPSEDVLEAMFRAMCDGALRNPDSDADEEGQGNMFFDMDSIVAGSFDPSITGVDEDPGDFEDGDADEEK